MIYVIPLIIALVLITAMIKKLPSYELFIDGAEEGMKIVSGIFPPLVAVLTAAYMLRASGTLDLIVSLLSPVTNLIPAEVMPLALIRPISGSGATGILTEILNNYGTDSRKRNSFQVMFYPCFRKIYAKTVESCFSRTHYNGGNST